MGNVIYETIELAAGDINLSQITWDTKKTSFQTIVSERTNSILLDGDSTYAKILNTAYVVTKGIITNKNLVTGLLDIGSGEYTKKDIAKELEELFEKLLLDREFLIDATNCYNDTSCDLPGFMAEKVVEEFLKIILTTAAQDSTFGAVKKIAGESAEKALGTVMNTIKTIKAAAGNIDIGMAAYHMDINRPDTYFGLIDMTAPDVDVTMSNYNAVSFHCDYKPFSIIESRFLGYRVYHGRSPINLDVLTETDNLDDNVFSYPNLDPGRHYFRITVYAGGNGEIAAETNSELITVEVYEDGVPPAPQNVQAWPGDEKVKLKWHPVLGANSYKIDYVTTIDGAEQSGTIDNISETTYTHTGLVGGATWADKNQLK
jgi:hypothetical protein